MNKMFLEAENHPIGPIRASDFASPLRKLSQADVSPPSQKIRASAPVDAHSKRNPRPSNAYLASIENTPQDTTGGESASMVTHNGSSSSGRGGSANKTVSPRTTRSGSDLFFSDSSGFLKPGHPVPAPAARRQTTSSTATSTSSSSGEPFSFSLTLSVLPRGSSSGENGGVEFMAPVFSKIVAWQVSVGDAPLFIDFFAPINLTFFIVSCPAV